MPLVSDIAREVSNKISVILLTMCLMHRFCFFIRLSSKYLQIFVMKTSYQILMDIRLKLIELFITCPPTLTIQKNMGI